MYMYCMFIASQVIEMIVPSVFVSIERKRLHKKSSLVVAKKPYV